MKYQGYLFIEFEHYSRVDVEHIAHEFVWECFNGVVPIGCMVEHIDKNARNNHISNLRVSYIKLSVFDCECNKQK